MDKIERWGMWHSKALAAGVRPELAALGRAVVRDYWQHGRDLGEARGEGPYLGADRHHQMMIALAVQKPDLAEAVFKASLGDGGPEGERLQDALAVLEGEHAPTGSAPHTAEWYSSAYQLDGCAWDLDTAEDRGRVGLKS